MPHPRSRSFSKSVSKSKSRSKSPTRRRSPSRSRSRSGSRSRSRSPVHKRRSYSRTRSLSRSRSKSPYRKRGSRSVSRSPMSNRKRHVGDRDAPPAGKCLGVFGLSLYTTEKEVKDLFEMYGRVEECKIVHDRASGRSRGFGFINMETVSDAEDAKERLDGEELHGRRIRVDYSITKRAHTPTPGKYMGRPSQSNRGYGRGYGGGGGGGGFRSNYGGGGGGYGRNNAGGSRYGYRRSRSRSRSRSPYYRDRY